MFYGERRGWAGADHHLSQLGIHFDVDVSKFKEEFSQGKLEAFLQKMVKQIQRHVSYFMVLHVYNVYRHFLHDSCGNQDVWLSSSDQATQRDLSGFVWFWSSLLKLPVLVQLIGPHLASGCLQTQLLQLLGISNANRFLDSVE